MTFYEYTMMQSNRFHPIFRFFLLTAAFVLFVSIVLGGSVSATGSGGACPDWPTCFGAWTPPVGQAASLAYAHRASSALAAVLLFATAWMSHRVRHTQPMVAGALWVAVLLMGLQVLMGAVVAKIATQGQSSWISAAHLGLSLLILAAAMYAVAFHTAYIHRERPSVEKLTSALSFRSPFSRLSLWSLGLVFLLLVSGAIVANAQVASVCSGWPLCNGSLIPSQPGDLLHLIHRGVVGMAALFIGRLLIQAWRTQRSQVGVLVVTTAAAVLFFAQAMLGSQLALQQPAYLLGIHRATAIAVWGAMVLQVFLVGLAARTPESEAQEAAQAGSRRGLFKDFLMLTKPVVVVLLLVTTYAGMVIGARSWPTLPLAFWTLVGGFMAAGGSGAINQYIDREDDQRMQRTQKRPIPSGRLTPAEGLAFGVGIALASFYVLTAFVNFLAALLSLAGIFYYVVLYSLLLKKTTVQNIVIGGGAGAIPPLVGWAAATGSLSIPSLFLFAVIFMWTPPHFWALALVRRNDYARAGVPMLPVVRGEQETRTQIMIYTAELVGLTLLLPLFGLGSSLYLAGAVVLGGWLLLAAWKVWKQGGNKLAWKMYRSSSMYLAFLFVVLMVDALI